MLDMSAMAWLLIYASFALTAGCGAFGLYRITMTVRMMREMTRRADAIALEMAMARITRAARGPEPLAEVLAPVAEGVPAGRVLCNRCMGTGRPAYMIDGVSRSSVLPCMTCDGLGTMPDPLGSAHAFGVRDDAEFPEVTDITLPDPVKLANMRTFRRMGEGA